MEQENNSKVVWFVAGVAIGATIALLYAPQSGEETRKKIRRKTEEGREVLSAGSRDLLDKGRDLFDKGRKIADDAAEMFERGRKLVQS